MTSQVSSPAEPADEAALGELREQRKPAGTKDVRRLDRVIIRFAGDSGDGMQLTGDRFTSETASFGNDLSTLPNFPAEIRAPAGTLPGVSSFQLHFADHDILTPGDAPNVLVAMNPAALKANIDDVPRGAEIIVNTDEFTRRAMQKVGYAASPLEDGSLDGYSVHPVPLTTLTVEALKEFDLSRKEAERSKNMFALGLLSWMYHRPTEGTEKFLAAKFAKKPEIAAANLAAFRAGWNFGETTEDFAVSYEVAPAATAFPVGTYRNISGNLALSYGLIAASRQADLPLYLGSYPITPASDILHELSRHKNFGVRTFQAEDEIAGIGAALGAAFGVPWRSRPPPVPGWRSSRRPSGSPSRSNCRCSSSTSSAADRPPGCRPRPSRRTCSRRCTAGTGRRRCRWSRRALRPTASTRPSRPPGSR